VREADEQHQPAVDPTDDPLANPNFSAKGTLNENTHWEMMEDDGRGKISHRRRVTARGIAAS
jgi:hypothetical protein